MRRIVTVIMSTVTALVLLLSYHTSTESTSVAASPVVQTPTSSATTPSATSSATPSTSLAAYTGDVVQTQWGPVQVRISVRAGKITSSEAVQYPNSNPKDVEINGYALPVLNQEVVQEQSALVDSVSGATVTSDGYLQSLQSAIDQAHL